MNWEAVAVIGLVTISIGAVLYLPIRLWFKRNQETEALSRSRVRLTVAGWILVFVALAVLFFGFAAQFFASESMVGQLTGTSIGRLVYAAFVALVFWIVEVLLKSAGVQLLNRE